MDDDDDILDGSDVLPDLSNCTGLDMTLNRSLVFGVSSLSADQDSAYVLRGWISCFVGVFGLIGNLLSVIVLTRPKLRILPINIILIFLTACDSIYILLYLMSWSIPTILARGAMEEDDTVKFDSSYMTYFRPKAYPYLYPLLWTAQNTSIGFTIFLTIERYIYVCKPMESSQIINRRKTILISILILISFILYELPLWWRFETVTLSPELLSNCPTSPHYIIKKNPIKEHPLMKVYLSKFKILAVHYLLPLLVLFTLNWRITSALKAIEARRRRLTRSEARNISYTKIVICVISLSCLTDIVFAVVAVVGYVRDENAQPDSHQFVYTLLKDITDLLLLINSSINFIFYSLLGMAFKQEFLKVFCPFDCTKALILPDVSEQSQGQQGGSLRRQSSNKA